MKHFSTLCYVFGKKDICCSLLLCSWCSVQPRISAGPTYIPSAPSPPAQTLTLPFSCLTHVHFFPALYPLFRKGMCIKIYFAPHSWHTCLSKCMHTHGRDTNLLPLYDALGHFHNETNALQYIRDVVDSPFLSNSQDPDSLKEHKHSLLSLILSEFLFPRCPHTECSGSLRGSASVSEITVDIKTCFQKTK